MDRRAQKMIRVMNRHFKGKAPSRKMNETVLIDARDEEFNCLTWRTLVILRGELRFLDVDEAADTEDALRYSGLLQITDAFRSPSGCRTEIHR